MQVITEWDLLPNIDIFAGDSMSTKGEVVIVEYSLVKKLSTQACAFFGHFHVQFS